MSERDSTHTQMEFIIVAAGNALASLYPHLNQLDPALQRALDGDRLAQFHVGDSDSAALVVASIAKNQVNTQNEIGSCLKIIGNGAFDEKFVANSTGKYLSADAAMRPKDMVRLLDAAWKTGKIWESGALAPSGELARQRADKGLVSNRLLYSLFLSIEAQCLMAWPQTITPKDVPFADEAFNELLMLTALRAEPLHLSATDLTERVQTFTANTQLELIATFLDNLTMIASMGAQGRAHAVRLFAQYQPGLFKDDLQSKLAMNRELAASYATMSDRHNHTQIKHMLSDYARASSNLVDGIDTALAFFRTVYARLGFDLPPDLRLPETVVATAAGTVAVKEEAPAAPKPLTAEEQEEIAVAREQLAQDTTQLTDRLQRLAGWRQSNTQRKKYGALLNNLRRGFRAGQVDFGQVPNPDGVVDTLVRLARLSGAETGTEQLRRAIAMERWSNAERGRIRTEAQKLGVEDPLQGALPPSVRSLTMYIADNWSHIRAALNHSAPNDTLDSSKIDLLLQAWQQLPDRDGHELTEAQLYPSAAQHQLDCTFCYL